MGHRYDLNQRISGGSMEPRLNPEFGGTHKIPRTGPIRPSPMVRATSGGQCVREETPGARRSRIGLPGRFFRE
jgi:hypothetical protein